MAAISPDDATTAIEQTNERFYGVYLLCSQCPDKRYNGKCYIGFTVNPNRRISQHNRGKDFGGAKKTSNKGPWKMVMIVHGFPNNISALQFEWAWQQPALSTRLKGYPELKRKHPKESYFQYNFRILNRMLLIGPWQRLPLIIRWLEMDYECDFPTNSQPPKHMEIVSGKIAIMKAPSTKRAKDLTQSQAQPRAIWSNECHICIRIIDDPERSRIGCINSLCKLTCHITCLANHIISTDIQSRGHYIPISGECHLCEVQFTWAALIERKRKVQSQGQSNEEIDNNEEDTDDFERFEDDMDNGDYDYDINSDSNDGAFSHEKDLFETDIISVKDVYELSD